MRVYKKLQDSMDDFIKVSEIIDYCNQVGESYRKMAEKAIKSTGKGESATSSLGAAAYFFERQRAYEYDIPNIITCIINEPLQQEGDEE